MASPPLSAREESHSLRLLTIPRKPVSNSSTDHLQHARDDGESQSEALLQRGPKSTLYDVTAVDSAGFDREKQQTQPTIHWPVEPKCLDKKGILKYTGMIWDVVLTLVPVIFLVFGFCASSLDRQPSSTFGDNIVEGLKLAPSVFPIVYAAIIGRVMRSAAQWIAERGARLGLLEQLVGSQSVFSSIERLVILQRYGPLSLAILILWLISPLGGQSSFRILESKPSFEQSQSNPNYLNVDDTFESEFNHAAGGAPGSAMTGIFQASLLASMDVRRSPVDVWNNVKVPMLDELSPWSPENPQNPWITVPANASETSYASLTGLVISGALETSKTQLNLETSYMQLQCNDGESSTLPGNIPSFDYAFPYGLMVHNAIYPFMSYPAYGGSTEKLSNSFFFDSDNVPLSTAPTGVFSQFNMLYGVRNWNDHTPPIDMTMFNCTIGTRHVELDVSCEGPACAVRRIRRSNLPGTADTHLTPFFNKVVFFNLCEFLGSSTGRPHSGDAAPLDYYVRGSDSPFAALTSTPNLADVDPLSVAKRLSVLLNTAWQVALAPLSIPQGSAAPWTDNSSNIYPADEGPRRYMANTTTATFITPGLSRYSTNKPFLAVFIGAAILLQACAVVGLVFKCLSTSPDILGYVSTQTRDNLLFADLVGGSTLDGLERARLLDKWKVQIGDTRPEDEIGHIALMKCDPSAGSSFANARVRKERFYL